MIVNDTVAAKLDWSSLPGTTLEGGFELGEILEAKDHVAHFRTRILGDSSVAAYCSFYAAEGASATEQLQIWQDLRGLKHPHLKTPLSSGRMKISGMGSIYVICSMPDETLSEILSDRGLTDEEGRELLKSLGEGLLHLHSNGFAHGALSPEMAVAVGEHIQLSTECVRRINAQPKIEVAKPRYLAPEVKAANVSMSADIWCLGATVFESLVQKKYERAWFGDLERMSLGPVLQRCLDTNPHTRARLSELVEAPQARTEATAVPASARARPVKVTRKPLEAKKVRPLDPSQMELVKFDANYGLERLRTRVKTSRSIWRPIAASIAAVVLLVVIVWLVILPKFQSIAEPAAEVQQPKTAWPTKTLGAAEAQVEESSVAGKRPVSDGGSDNQAWRFVLGSYDHEADADRRIQLLNKTHPDLDVRKVPKAARGPFFVVSGGPMTEMEATELRKRALRMGISRASYVTKFSAQ